MALDRLNQVCVAICIYGLHVQPRDVPEAERAMIRKQVELMLSTQAGVPTRELVEAIRYGMYEVWPFTQQAYFDARDVRNNIAKAKAVANRMRLAGKIPMTISEVRATRSMHEGG